MGNVSILPTAFAVEATDIIEIGACYQRIDLDESATLFLESDRHYQGCALTILHDTEDGPRGYDLVSPFKQELLVSDGQTITLIAHAGGVVAAGVYEVSSGCNGCPLLLPRCTNNLVIHQFELSDGTHTTLHEPTPTTLQLDGLMSTVQGRYHGQRLPYYLGLLWPALATAIKLNDEEHSTKMLQALSALLADEEVRL